MTKEQKIKKIEDFSGKTFGEVFDLLIDELGNENSEFNQNIVQKAWAKQVLLPLLKPETMEIFEDAIIDLMVEKFTNNVNSLA